MIWASIHVSIACFPRQGGQRYTSDAIHCTLYACTHITHLVRALVFINKYTLPSLFPSLPSLPSLPFPLPQKMHPRRMPLFCQCCFSVSVSACSENYPLQDLKPPGSWQRKRVGVRNHRKNCIYLELLIVMVKSFLRARGGTGGGGGEDEKEVQLHAAVVFCPYRSKRKQRGYKVALG